MGRLIHARAPWLVVALACMGEFMVVLDASVVNVALPSIRAGLGFAPLDLPWVVNGYGLVFAGFLLLGGRLSDLHGRRRALTGGLALFSAASLVAGSSVTPGMLVVARMAQGLGAAILTPATLTVITTTFAEGPRRTRALATWTAVASAGGAAGNLIGGVLTDVLSWRWTLLVNVPIGVLVIVLVMRHLDRDTHGDPHRALDVPGAALATVGLVALTFGVTSAQTRGWTAPPTLGALAVGVLLLAAFAAVEARVATAPLLPPRLLRIATVGRGNVIMVLAGACFMPMWYFLSLSMQEVLGYTALQTAIGFLPHTLLAVVVGARAAPWIMRFVPGRTLIVVGAVLSALGFWWQSRLGVDSTYLSGILGPAIAISIGAGLLNTPLTEVVTAGVDADDAGAASGLMNTTKQVGGAIGLAGLIVVAATATRTTTAIAHGYGHAFLGMAVILLITAAVGLILPRPVTRSLTSDRATRRVRRAPGSR